MDGWMGGCLSVFRWNMSYVRAESQVENHTASKRFNCYTQIHTQSSKLLLTALGLIPARPALRQLSNAVPEHVAAEPGGDFPSGLEHAAAGVAQQADNLERLHAALLALDALGGQQLQQDLVGVERLARDVGALLGGRCRRRRHEVGGEGERERGEQVGGLEALCFGDGGGGRRDGDVELEVGEQRAGEVRVPVAALEDDAVEAIVGDGDGPVRLVPAARRETLEPARVQHRHPLRLPGAAPVQQDQEGAGGVVDVWIARVGEEDVAELGAGGQGERVFALADVAAADVLDGVDEASGAGAVDGPVVDGYDVVVPAGAGHGRAAFLAVHAQGRAEQGVDADVVG